MKLIFTRKSGTRGLPFFSVFLRRRVKKTEYMIMNGLFIDGSNESGSTRTFQTPVITCTVSVIFLSATDFHGWWSTDIRRSL